MPKVPGNDHAQLVILSLLESGPMYGYAISKEVSRRSDEQLRLTPGVLYPILKAMEADGLIAAEWEEIKSDRRDDEAGEGRRRKWYKLSAKGRKRLTKQVEAHRAWRSIIDLFIAPAREREPGAER
jgi:DNA-binding PadR family transcriptional regulator